MTDLPKIQLTVRADAVAHPGILGIDGKHVVTVGYCDHHKLGVVIVGDKDMVGDEDNLGCVATTMQDLLESIATALTSGVNPSNPPVGGLH